MEMRLVPMPFQPKINLRQVEGLCMTVREKELRLGLVSRVVVCRYLNRSSIRYQDVEDMLTLTR